MTPELNISLAAIAQNYRLLQNRFSGRECAAVVKAKGYGLGAPQVAKALLEAGCRKLFVSYVSEAVELKEAGIDAEIYVLHGISNKDDVREALENGFIPVLNNRSQLGLWPKDKPCAAHFDTGMTRLGFAENEYELLKDYNVKMVMSHLACAEEPDFPLNEIQLNRFGKIAGNFPQAEKSLVNSSGIFLGNEYHFDLARPGIALYGGNPVEGENPVRNVATLHAPILQIHNITESCTVGYSATYLAEPGDVIATVSCGYADILPRSLSNRGRVWIEGHSCPIVGIISMDLITIKINNLPRELHNVGQNVEILGENYTIAQMAKDAGTIEYEILTKLGGRFRKNYV